MLPKNIIVRMSVMTAESDLRLASRMIKTPLAERPIFHHVIERASTIDMAARVSGYLLRWICASVFYDVGFSPEAPMNSFIDRVETLDLSLFGRILSQTTDDDRRSLLAVQRAVAKAHRTYTYLEIGSHMGGSIQPHLVDARQGSPVDHQ